MPGANIAAAHTNKGVPELALQACTAAAETQTYWRQKCVLAVLVSAIPPPNTLSVVCTVAAVVGAVCQV